jgi:hypothetical protein
MLKTLSRVDADHLCPLLLRHAVQHGVTRDAGVVDEHVDGADLLRHLGAAGSQAA